MRTRSNSMEKNGNKREGSVRRSNDFQKSIELVLRVVNASNDVWTHNTSVRNLPERLYVRVYETEEESYRVGSRTLARIRLRSIELCLGDDFGNASNPISTFSRVLSSRRATMPTI